MRIVYQPIGAILILLLLSACNSTPKLEEYLPDQRLEYKKQTEASENLELPPDLASGSFDDALDIPSSTGSTTFSDYAGGRAQRAKVASSGQVLPDVKGVTLERTGDQRWLEIDAPPQSVWPKVVAFWRQQGILLLEQDPAVGVMKTDWLENRAELRNDFVTKMLRKVADGLYATSTRDQYRVRLDAGAQPGTTDLYLTHRGMEEKLVRNTLGEGSNTVWEPSGTDPDKEAAMLRRLMLYLGVSDQSAQRMLAKGGGTAAPATAAPRLVSLGGGSALIIPEDFRRAWRQTGLALDRSGFAVEDRDRSGGIFFVRYDDPQRGQQKKSGILSKLAFWDSDKISKVEQYQVRLVEEKGETQVTIHDNNGARDTSPTSERILSLLQEQMR